MNHRLLDALTVRVVVCRITVSSLVSEGSYAMKLLHNNTYSLDSITSNIHI